MGFEVTFPQQEPQVPPPHTHTHKWLACSKITKRKDLGLSPVSVKKFLKLTLQKGFHQFQKKTMRDHPGKNCLRH